MFEKYNEKVIPGEKYNFWTAIELVDNKHDGVWLCQCMCGRKRRMTSQKLLMYKNHKMDYNGCGYCEKEWFKGHPIISSTGEHIPVYNAWCNMKGRCLNPKHQNYKHYGKRGITIFSEWIHDFISFYNYVSQLDHYGEPGRSLDRIDNEKGYFPGNLRWATAKEQANNRRVRK